MSSDAQIAREWAETRALADMTPAEQAQCVGMWADVTVAGMTFTEVIGAPPSDGMVTLVDPNGGRTYQLESLPLDEITPRFDLPRAWTPSGEPVPGEWEYHPAYAGVCQDGTTSLNLIGVPTCSKQDAEWQRADIHRDEPAVRFFLVRSYITDWEVPHESR